MSQMDFSAFTQATFDPVDWLNATFPVSSESDVPKKNAGSGDNKEIVAQNLVYKLQLMVEETNHSLEEIGQRMSLAIPKVIGEAEALNREAAELYKQVCDVRGKLISQEKQASNAVGNLIELDSAKFRFQEAYKALQEANNWTTLTTDVEEVFESGQVEQIGAKLSAMQKSLEMLSLSSSYDAKNKDKLETLERLKDRFEAIVEPLLAEAFQNLNTKSIELYSKLFKEFHRSGRLVTIYHDCFRSQLLKEWSIQVKLDSKQSLLNWLNILYDRLSVVWKTQMNFSMKVLYPDDFSQSLKVISDIYNDILMSLDPTIEFCMDEYIQQIEDQQGRNTRRQEALIELKQLTNQFVRGIEQNIAEHHWPADNEPLNVFVPRVSSLDIFIRSIYRPFAIFNDIFIQLENNRLQKEFVALDDPESHHSLISNETLIKIFVLAKNSVKLYTQYVEAYPILILENAIEPLFGQFFAAFQRSLKENISGHLIKHKFLNSSEALIQRAQHQEHRRSNSGGGNLNVKKLSTSSSMTALSSLQTSFATPNWHLVQQSFNNFQIIGEFCVQLDKFHNQVKATLEENYARFHPQNSSENHYFSRFDLFVLNLDSNIELNEQIENNVSSLGGDDSSMILRRVQNESQKMCELAARVVCDAILDYTEVHFSGFVRSLRSQLEDELKAEDEDEDDDGLALSPNEFITQIGQYLLTLPQHLEPFNPNENPAFKVALHKSLAVFEPNPNPELDIENSATELLLDCLLRRVMRLFMTKFRKLEQAKMKRKLTLSWRKQIGVDLAYILAVCEDLGLSLEPENEFLLLLRILNDSGSSRDSFDDLRQSSNDPTNLFTVVERIFMF